MEIEILHLTEGAKKAKGTVVIIDVFRAFSLVCYMFDKGVEKVIPVADVSTAFEIREKYPDYILVGERENKKVEGFDYGNSPSEILNSELKGKTVVHTTSAGTQGLVNARAATELLTGSFVNAGAIIKYLFMTKPQHISLVCMGYASKHPIEEDTFCAGYIKTMLEGEEPDFNKMHDIIMATSGQRFFNPLTQGYCPKEDFYLCLKLDAFNFIVKAFKDKNFGTVLKKVNIK